MDKEAEESKEEDTTPLPGAMPSQAAAAIPDWYKVGWRAFTDLDKPDDQDKKDERMLHAFISEQYYGDWYHNAGIIIFVRVPPHFLPGLLTDTPNDRPCLLHTSLHVFTLAGAGY